MLPKAPFKILRKFFFLSINNFQSLILKWQMENSQLSLCLTSRERLRFGQYHGANRNHWIA